MTHPSRVYVVVSKAPIEKANWLIGLLIVISLITRPINGGLP